MLGFLVEVLEKGPSTIQSPVLTIIHCLLHYVDMTTATQTINSDLLRTVAKFVEVTTDYLIYKLIRERKLMSPFEKY